MFRISFDSKGGERVRRDLQNLKNVFSAYTYQNMLNETGEQIKNNVINNIYKTNAISSGQLLSELNKQSPTTNIIKNSKRYKIVRVGYGNIYRLNRIRRQPRDVKVSLKTSRGKNISRTISFGAGTVPYWIILEWGSLGKSETPPSFLNVPSSSKTSQYVMRFWGYESTKGGRKPVFSMVPASQKRPHEKPHPGVRPRRVFRRGLRSVVIRRVLERKLQNRVRSALS